MKYKLTLKNRQMNLETNAPIIQTEEIELFMRQVAKGDKGDKGDTGDISLVVEGNTLVFRPASSAQVENHTLLL